MSGRDGDRQRGRRNERAPELSFQPRFFGYHTHVHYDAHTHRHNHNYFAQARRSPSRNRSRSRDRGQSRVPRREERPLPRGRSRTEQSARRFTLNLLHAISHLLCVIDYLPAADKCLLLCVVGRLPAADECPLQRIRVTLVVILPYFRVTLVNILLPIRVTLFVIVTLEIKVNTTAKGLDLGPEVVRGSHMSVVSLVFRSLPNATSGTSSVD